jgi:hypothetical protein
MADTLIIDPEYWLITKNNTSEQVVANGKNIIQVFPTPFINCFSIYIHNLMSPVAHLQIYDSGGKLMMRKDLEVSGSLFFEVNAQAFARGIYFIKIQTDNGFKFVKKYSDNNTLLFLQKKRTCCAKEKKEKYFSNIP